MLVHFVFSLLLLFSFEIPCYATKSRQSKFSIWQLHQDKWTAKRSKNAVFAVEDLVAEIGTYLDPVSVTRLRCTHPGFRSILSSEKFEQYYRKEKTYSPLHLKRVDLKKAEAVFSSTVLRDFVSHLNPASGGICSNLEKAMPCSGPSFHSDFPDQVGTVNSLITVYFDDAGFREISAQMLEEIASKPFITEIKLKTLNVEAMKNLGRFFKKANVLHIQFINSKLSDRQLLDISHALPDSQVQSLVFDGDHFQEDAVSVLADHLINSKVRKVVFLNSGISEKARLTLKNASDVVASRYRRLTIKLD